MKHKEILHQHLIQRQIELLSPKIEHSTLEEKVNLLTLAFSCMNFQFSMKKIFEAIFKSVGPVECIKHNL